MRQDQELIVGWLDSGIAHLLETDREFFRRFSYVLISKIDSTIDVREVSVLRIVMERYPESFILDRGLCVTSSVFVDSKEISSLFTGFDELWYFYEAPSIPKPSGISITSPLNVQTDEVPSALARWMEDSRCALGLGDGIGLNYVTRDAGIAMSIESHVAD